MIRTQSIITNDLDRVYNNNYPVIGENFQEFFIPESFIRMLTTKH
ncbi:hypothetical protein LCGC14_1789400 [marine sediment metagenome]|uniref:Uncharacterized protein n=1 Tax=marine sediment metagenome TaxID=412755 RepID=A0A0F9GT18_9ZZZZ